MTNHESFGGGCVVWCVGLFVALAVLSVAAGKTNLPGIVLGWLF